MILLMAALGWPKDGARWEAYGVAVCNVLPVFIGAYDEYVASLGKADQLDGEVRSALGQMVYGIVGLLPSGVGATEHASMRGYTLGANLLSFVPYLDRLALVGDPAPVVTGVVIGVDFVRDAGDAAFTAAALST